MDDGIGVQLIVTMPTTMEVVVEDLAAKLGLPRGETVRRAILLLKALVDEGQSGDRLAILRGDDEVVREVVGIWPAPPTA
jgi:hypothetical protein